MVTLSRIFSTIQGTFDGAIRGPVQPLCLNQVRWDEDLFIYHHLGLGDMIHCNGMVRYLLKRLHSDRSVQVFCKTRNASMTRWMYRDEPRIRIIELDDGEREKPQVERILRQIRSNNYLCVGHRDLRPLLKQHPHLFFDELFYLQLEIPYASRYEECYWDRDLGEEERVFSKVAMNEPYAFVHDDPARGFSVDTSAIAIPIVRNDPTESLFHMGLVLERASEVHCMESSIRCMIESLDMSRSRLYYHNFRYPERPLGTATRQKWISIEYTKEGRAIGASCPAN
jgi:hypothetical protein